MQAAHLCIIQPAGQKQALAYLDPALLLRQVLRAAGVPVTLGKNRLRHDVVNFVFGAHLAIDAEALERHPCVLVNLEPLGDAAAELPPQYLKLLEYLPVVDADAANLPAYRRAADSHVPVLHLGALAHAVDATPSRPLAERPIELLLIGALTPRRTALLQRIQAQGVQVARLDAPLYGPERDELVRNARAVLLLNAGEHSRFDVLSAAAVLAAGTPVIAETVRGTPPDAVYSEAVQWLNPEHIETFFGHHFRSDRFGTEAAQALQHHARQGLRHELDALLALGQSVRQNAPPATPLSRLNADLAASGYRTGWLNVAAAAWQAPDAQLDLSTAQLADTPLQPRLGSFELIHAAPVALGTPQAAQLLGNALALLRPAGRLVLHVALPAGQTDAQAWAQQALADVSHEFWRSGGFMHRFSLTHAGGLDAAALPACGAAIRQLRLVLSKVECSLTERTQARLAREDFALPA
ncbi:MAG: hypothetical protein AB3X44_00845 [Leptothrix sp. (in: b-proteobacteria)]